MSVVTERANHTSQQLMRPAGRWAWIILLLAVATILFAPVASAQRPTPTLDEINAVARELYCPLCNGVRLDTCELQACVQMRQVIADQLAAGVPKEQIKSDFVAQYGPVVLGEPPREGLDLLAWILPIAALIIGAGALVYIVYRWTRPSHAPAVAASSAGPSTAAAGDAVIPGDDYLARVEADLEREDS